MKINIFLTVISILMGVLIAYLLYLAYPVNSDNALVYSIVGGVCYAVTFVGMLGVGPADSRLRINARVMSNVFLVLFLVVTFLFAIFTVRISVLSVVCALLLLIYIAAYYKMCNVDLKQDKKHRALK